MNKRGQGGSELRVHEKRRMMLRRREFANYLRENSGVKVYSTSSEIIVWFPVCAGDSSPRALKNAGRRPPRFPPDKCSVSHTSTSQPTHPRLKGIAAAMASATN